MQVAFDQPSGQLGVDARQQAQHHIQALPLDRHNDALDVAALADSGIVRKKRGVTPDTALRLARYFNSTPQFWMNLQASYDLKTAQLASGTKIEREVLPHAA